MGKREQRFVRGMNRKIAMDLKGPRALITTIEPIDGGVPSMTFWICELLENIGITPILAWYAPWRNEPGLSVPVFTVLVKRPGCRMRSVKGRYQGWGIGAWFPELEFTHYWPSKHWKRLVDSCQIHLTVSGNALAAIPYVLLNKPFIAWLATPWDADRKDRVKSFGLPRKCLDAVMNRRIILGLEKKVLQSPKSRIVSLSKYTAREFSRLASRELTDVMKMPVKREYFYSDNSKRIRWRIGFAGRYCDPRKNIGLLLKATRILINRGYSLELVLVGDRNPEMIRPIVQDLELDRHIRFYESLRSEELGNLLRTFDVFVIPSHQEGLCISALEAMACGVPVVSTRCGGPEEYVIPDLTGLLIENDADQLANAIHVICSEDNRRALLSTEAERWVSMNASSEISSSLFYKHLSDLTSEIAEEKLLLK